MVNLNEMKSKLKKDGEFIPPDGGWGWMIIFAAGLSNVSSAILILIIVYNWYYIIILELKFKVKCLSISIIVQNKVYNYKTKIIMISSKIKFLLTTYFNILYHIKQFEIRNICFVQRIKSILVKINF